ncbi:hypothetical protein [Clavibacter capsici]|uniref:hypothetical protein n=1 Tax=Clavibacter capsici TaxID=1874630 RepID=UPI001428567E|nr:hypothetical protein [Clavibacter capsici]QIS39117.1 hypothetical protein GW572_07660 [Clavibacter capsici]
MPTFELVTETSWLEYAAVIVAALSSVVIAWQAFLTRSAVKASRDAVEASKETVRVAEAALRESQLARLETQVPRVFVTTGPYVFADTVTMITRVENRTTYGDASGDKEFRVPRDATTSLSVDLDFQVRNDGPGTVALLFSASAEAADDEGSNLVGPLQSQVFTVKISRTVQQWIQLAGRADVASEFSELKPCFAITIKHVGPRDSDVEEVHEIRAFGSVLKEDPQAVGTWVINGKDFGDDFIETLVLPAQRTYWKSRSRKEKYLPE